MGGSTSLSTAGRGSVWGVCHPSFWHWHLGKFATDDGTEQYALTEASYTLVKLMQRFDTLENADPHAGDPVLVSSLTMSHDRGVLVRLYSSADCGPVETRAGTAAVESV